MEDNWHESKAMFAHPLRTLLLAAWACSAAMAAAVDFPPYHTMNPWAEARSGLYFQPRVDLSNAWSFSASLAYGTMVEMSDWWKPSPVYVFDAEVFRMDLCAVRRLGARDFVLAALAVGSAHDGVFDPFMNAFHRAFGAVFPERDREPTNRFVFHLALPDGTLIERGVEPIFLGDLRLAWGRHWTPWLQGLLSLTIPTATGTGHSGRGVPSLALMHTARVPIFSRLLFEGGLGFGWTPRAGELSSIQNECFMNGNAGLRLVLWGGFHLFGNLYAHSPLFHDSGAYELNDPEASLDFGFLHATRSGFSWWIAATEDFRPSGTAIDFALRLGTAW